ncbi:uncharacterized protein LOC116801787 [Drosophila sechellia]|uniref:uncharacterized protein LOC116801787 n=1 Tax=Drosophila sechellia TaxID=7238 RepID=UPI0013DE6034|nr:uncharacterized protein LOC116801787 [Drosophila sechellia]
MLGKNSVRNAYLKLRLWRWLFVHGFISGSSLGHLLLGRAKSQANSNSNFCNAAARQVQSVDPSTRYPSIQLSKYPASKLANCELQALDQVQSLAPLVALLVFITQEVNAPPGTCWELEFWKLRAASC